MGFSERSTCYKLASITVDIKSPLAFIMVFWTFLQGIGAHPYRARPAVVHSKSPLQHRGSWAELSMRFKWGLTDPLGRECSPKLLLKIPLPGVPGPLPRSAP